MPMTMFASMIVNPSHTYGRHHSSRPNSRMIQAPPGDRDPRSLARRRSPPGPRGEREYQHQHGDGVGVGRGPFEQPGREAEHEDHGGRPDGEPDRLAVPDRGHEGGDVRLPGRVQCREPVRGEQYHDAGERLIDLAEAGAHWWYPYAWYRRRRYRAAAGPLG